MASPRLISIVIPTMNEEENLPLFYEALKATTDGTKNVRWEFIFVDDGSTDQTASRILDLRKADPRVRLIQLSRNFGGYAAIRAGFENSRGNAVVSISADMQDPPEIIREFISYWKEGYHIVWGVRETRDDPWSKRFLARMFYRVIRKLALPDLPQDGMDCGLFDRKVIDEFLAIRDKNNIAFMTIHWMGLRQAHVQYHRRARRFGVTKWPLRKRIESAVDVITSFSFFPIRLASYIGFALSAVSIVGGFAIIYNRIFLGIGALGWPSIMVALLFLSGWQFIMLGIIGEYLWRIGSEVRGRPHFIVMNRVGFGEEE